MSAARFRPLLMMASITSVLALSGNALAANDKEIDTPKTNSGEAMHFDNLDKNGDGVLALAELPQDHALGLDFGHYDLDHDGSISTFEFGEYYDQL